MNGYKLFVLNNVSFTDVSRTEQDIFGALLTLRIRGYFDFHGHSVMPVDHHDHYCTNLLLCEEQNGCYEPIACAKIVTLSDCRHFGHIFPPIEILERSENGAALDSVHEIVRQAMVAGEELSYDCSFTIAPHIRRSSKSRAVAKLMFSLWLNFHQQRGINRFVLSATLTTKTDRMFTKLGCTPVCDDASYRLYCINNEPALMMHFNDYTPLAHSWMKSAQAVWNARDEIGNSRAERQLNVA